MTSDQKVTPATGEDPPPAARRRRWVLSGKSLEALALPIAWVVVIVIFSILRPGTFLSSANFASILASQAVLVVVSLALVIVLTAGDYDLSVASMVGLSANLIAILNVNYGLPVLVAILVALLAGLVVG